MQPFIEIENMPFIFRHPEHHPDAFYQGEKKPAKVIFVGGTYRLGAHPETGFKVWERFGNRARLVDMTGDIKRSKFYLPGISSRHVWDWRIIVCGSEVDVEDALRFACSLFVHNEGAGAPSSRYFDFWSLGSGQRLNNGDGTTLGEHQLENRIQVLRSRVLDLEIESDDMEAKVNDLEMENERLRKRIAELEGTGSGELESAPGAGSGGQSPKRSRSNGDDGPGRKRQR